MYIWDHIRHRRGFAVHSPFMYGVVRGAMMPRRIVGPRRELYDALVALGTDRRSATRIQNLHTHLGYEQWTIDGAVDEGLVVVSPNCPAEQVLNLTDTLAEGQGEATLVVLHHRNKGQKALAERLVAEHQSMSGSKRDFTFLVYGRALPKQHIIL